MKGVSVLIILGLLGLGKTQFLNHRPFPTYSLENMPETDFSCRDKILGGYYADVDTMCQMFHICVKVAGVGVQDFRFLCPNGTAFDQDHQICAEWEDVDCDASTLYYSSDNFDLYRIGSGFESKAVKYGEDEETFALQRAETGDARLNREHQKQRVNQKNQPAPFKKSNDKDIFKESSSSHFFNNRNGGKETDDDEDDNVNVNQNNDNFQRKKLRKQPNRRPVQNEDEQRTQRPQENRRPVQNQNFNNNNNRRPVQNENQQNRRPQNNDNQNRRPNQNENFNQENKRPQSQNNQENKRPQSQNNQQNNRPVQNADYQNRQQNNRPQNDYQNNNNNNKPQTTQQPIDYRHEKIEAQTYRPNRPTGFINNFAGSSYVPTTSKPVSTTEEKHNVNDNRYNPQYTISTPAPFKQNQQYNSPPNRQTTQYNNGQYNPTTQQPQKETENYPNFKQQNFNKPTENYASSKFTQKQTENYPTQGSRNNNNQYNDQYDIPKIKPTENYPSQAPTRNQYHNQFNGQKSKPTQPPVNRNNYNDNNEPTSNRNNFNNNYNQNNGFSTTQGPRVTQYNTHYDVPKVKQPTTPFKNDHSTQFNKKPTTSYKNENFPTTFAPKFNKNQNYPSTFSPRTNPDYTPISHQTTQYNSHNNFNQQSTPRTTPFTQYTPTVPKITSTTPVARSNRFDETQYDDGSYDPKYDRNNDDEFLKTAHSQNIASSRNEFSKSAKNQPSTQKPHYESPRPFSVSPNTPKAADFPKSTQKPFVTPKKVKDTSYDYAYYDTNVGSEPEYEIDTEIKKSHVKN